MNTGVLLQELKKWRSRTADSEGVEPFRVFANRVLEEIAEVRPKSGAELLAIKGIREKKLARYGKEILVLLNGSKDEIPNREKVLSVGELISLVNNYFSSLGILKVRGDITEVSFHPHGYCFFTMKDSQTKEHSVSCYVARWKFDSLSHLVEVGMEVVVDATPSVYKTGRFSLTVDAVEPYGEGALKRAFEALKKKLETKGYFDTSRKRPIPEFIQKIGLITSEYGAAIKDFRENLGNYGFEIYFRDVRVEGDHSEQSIISALKWFNKNVPTLDVLVLIRGGGGLEELKAFNSEGVAEAIVLSRLPIITGIGHERDETIADYVADRRFSTPTAAAVFIKVQREHLIAEVGDHSRNLISLMDRIFDNEMEYFLMKSEELKNTFAASLERYKLVFSKVVEQMSNCLSRIFREFRAWEQNLLRLVYGYENDIQRQLHLIHTITQRLLNSMERRFEGSQGTLKIAETTLLSFNPENSLRRGYSIVYNADKHILKEASAVKIGEKIFVKLYKGGVGSRVEQIEN